MQAIPEPKRWFDCENVCLRPSRHAVLEGLDGLKQTVITSGQNTPVQAGQGA
jgi:hypothetical protein